MKLFDEEFSGGKQNINQASTYMVFSEEKGEHGRYFDSCVTHHVTNDLSDLNIKIEFKGGEKVMRGDDSSISITHLGNIYFLVHNKTVSLKKCGSCWHIFKQMILFIIFLQVLELNMVP